MKYFSIDTVIKAYQNNAKCTSNKFWGVLGILCAIGSSIKPGVSYRFNPSITADFLQRLFSFGEIRDFSGMKSTYFVIFSKNWVEKLGDIMCSYTPNFYDVCAWFFRNHEFSSAPSNDDLLNLFSQETGLNSKQIDTLFEFGRRNLIFSEQIYEDTDLRQKLSAIYGNKNRYTSISSEGMFIKANPGEFSRAPFIQTIYAAQRAPECLLLTQFDLLKSYSLRPNQSS